MSEIIVDLGTAEVINTQAKQLTILDEPMNGPMSQFKDMAFKEVTLDFGSGVYVVGNQFAAVRYRFSTETMEIQLQARSPWHIDNQTHAIAFERLNDLPEGFTEPYLQMDTQSTNSSGFYVSANNGSLSLQIHDNKDNVITLSSPLFDNTLTVTVKADPNHLQ